MKVKKKKKSTYYLARKELLIYLSAKHHYGMSSANWDSLGRKKSSMNSTGHSFPVVPVCMEDPGKSGNPGITVVSKEKSRYASLPGCTYANVNLRDRPQLLLYVTKYKGIQNFKYNSVWV